MMSFFSKLISSLKVKEDIVKCEKDDEFIAKGKLSKERFVEKRKYKRVPVLASFCVFVYNEGEEVDHEKAPFINAWVYDISLGGAALKCDSFVACTPYDSTIEKVICQNMFVELVPNVSVDSNGCSSCGGGGCASHRADEDFAPKLGNAPIKAQVMWVSGNHFGCMFVNPTEAFTSVVDEIINEVSKECSKL